MSKYHEPWSQGKFLLSDVTGGTPSKDVIKNIDEMQSKQIYVHFATDKQRRIAITNDARIAGRIALCVNACAGITNEALEQGIVQEGLDAMKVVHLVVKPIISDSIPELKTFMGVKIWEDSDGK